MFFNMYHLMGDISEKLFQCIVAAFPQFNIIGYDRSAGADKSFVRILNYVPGGGFHPHVDTGCISISLCGTSVGLAVKNPKTGAFCYPEKSMNPDDELVVILGAHIAELMLDRMKPSVHSVSVMEPRQVAVFSVETDPCFLAMMTDEDELDPIERLHKARDLRPYYV